MKLNFNLAGIYLKEEVIEGTFTAAFWGAAMLIPLIFIKKPSLLRKLSNLAVGLGGAIVVFTFLEGAFCPHYWRIALPALIAIGTLLLGIVRFSFEKKLKTDLKWYLILIIFSILFWGLRWSCDIVGVVKGQTKTRAEYASSIEIESSVDAAAQEKLETSTVHRRLLRFLIETDSEARGEALNNAATSDVVDPETRAEELRQKSLATRSLGTRFDQIYTRFFNVIKVMSSDEARKHEARLSEEISQAYKAASEQMGKTLAPQSDASEAGRLERKVSEK